MLPLATWGSTSPSTENMVGTVTGDHVIERRRIALVARCPQGAHRCNYQQSRLPTGRGFVGAKKRNRVKDDSARFAVHE